MNNLIAILSALLLFGCSASQEHGQKSEDNFIEQNEKVVETISEIPVGSKKTEKPIAEKVQQNVSTGYLVVTFSSRGSGIDGKAMNKLDEIVISLGLNKAESTPLEKVSWGREGEIDYCFDLSLIDEELTTNLKNQLNSEFSGNNLVQIEHHENCPRKKS